MSRRDTTAAGRRQLRELEESLDLQGSEDDADKLEEICELDEGRGSRLCRRVLKEGGAALRTKALELLPRVGKPGEAEAAALRVLAETRESRGEREEESELWEQACRLLASSTSDEVLEELIALLDRWNLEPNEAMETLARLPHPKTTDRLLQELDRVMAALAVAPDPSPLSFGFLPDLLPDVLADRPDGDRAAERLIALAQQPPRSGPEGDGVRQCAIRALGKLIPRSAAALSALIEFAANPDKWISLEAVRALGEGGPHAAAAIPELLALLGRPRRHFYVRCEVPLTLGKVGPGDSRVLPVLVDLMQKERGQISVNALWALARMGPAARDALPALLALGRAGGVKARRVPAAVAQLDSDGTTGVPFLASLLHSSDRKLRISAIEALRRYREKAAPALPALRLLLHDPACRREALATLGWMGTAARPALPDVLDALRAGARTDYFYVVRDLDPEGAEAIPGLVRLLDDPKPAVRRGALDALESYGPAAARAASAVRERFRDPSPSIRAAAAEALKVIMPGDEQSGIA